MADPKVFTLEIEERLYADQTGELKTSVLKELLALQATLQGERRQLNSRERYRELQAALLAVDGAIDALSTLRIR